MDAVISGLVAGVSVSILLIFGGVVAYASDLWMRFTTPPALFAWLVILTTLTAGQLAVTTMVLQKLSAAPAKGENATAA